MRYHDLQRWAFVADRGGTRIAERLVFNSRLRRALKTTRRAPLDVKDCPPDVSYPPNVFGETPTIGKLDEDTDFLFIFSHLTTLG